MPYLIEQMEGDQVEASRALCAAVDAGNEAEARAIYQRVTGTTVPEHLDLTHKWWVYNAPANVRYFRPRTAAEERRYYALKESIHEEWAACKLVKLAESLRGGVWEYYYEY